MCAEPTKTASALRSDAAPHASSSTLPAHRVLELGAVRLHARSGAPAAAATGAPISTWFAKTRSAGQMLLQRGRVQRDVALPFSAAGMSWSRTGSRPS